jgi:uncharacterized lipoprotein YehR (DUF1307 family)
MKTKLLLSTLATIIIFSLMSCGKNNNSAKNADATEKSEIV